jgi:hypothetical protein
MRLGTEQVSAPSSSAGPAAAARRRYAPWAALAVLVTAALCSVRPLPFYDYYLWLYQGHVIGALLFGAAPGPAALSRVYALSAVPVPNLAAPVLIGLLNACLPVEVAGLVVVVGTVLGFSAAFAFLVRSVQRRPTWVEYSGVLWAFGFFLEKGYLSYVIGLALAFVLVGVLQRVTTGPGRLTPPVLASIAALGLALYLSHLIAWSIGMLAVATHALVLARRGRRRDALRLALTALPGALLLCWYVLAVRGGSGLMFYTSWANKVISLAEPLLFFLRLDPFPPPFPVFAANLGAGLAVLGLLAVNTDWAGVRAACATRPVLWVSAMTAAVALLVPLAEVNELIKPDERFVLPAALLALAALPHRPLRPRTAVAVAVLVVAALGLHVVEYRAAAPRIGQIDAMADAAIPAGSRVLELAVPSHAGCTPAFGPSVGVPTLKWFGVDHLLETGGTLVALDETSIVHARPDAGPPQLTALTPATPAEAVAAALSADPAYPSVLVVGCPADVDGVVDGLAPTYGTAARAPASAVLSRRH